jgi:NADPH2:quinone reductase
MLAAFCDRQGAAADVFGACLGIPGITAHRCVFGDGPTARQLVREAGSRGKSKYVSG